MKTIITNSSVLIIVILLLTSCFTSVSFNKPAPPEIMTRLHIFKNRYHVEINHLMDIPDPEFLY